MNFFAKLFRTGGLVSISKTLKTNATSFLAIVTAVVAVVVIMVGTSYRNVSNFSSGTLNDGRLSGNIARLNNPSSAFIGRVRAQSFEGALIGNADSATSLALDPADCAAGSFANAIDKLGDLGCSYDGSSLSNLDASKISNGTISDSRLSANVPRLDSLSVVFNGKITASSFSGNFNGNISGNIVGNVTGNVTGNASTATALAANPADCAASAFANAIDSTGNLSCSTDGSGLTNLNASNITSGTLDNSHLQSDVALTDANNIFSTDQTIDTDSSSAFVVGDSLGVGAVLTVDTDTPFVTISSTLDVGGFDVQDVNTLTANTLTDGTFSVNGGTITGASLDGSEVSGDISGNAAGFNGSLAGDVSGAQGSTVVNSVSCSNCVADGALSGNVALLNALTNLFTGDITAASFSGDGANITNIDGSHVASAVVNATNSVNTTNVSGGTVDSVAITNSTIDSTVTGDASGLTNIQDSALSSNVTLQGNTFNGANELVQLNSSGDLDLGGNDLVNVGLLHGDGSLISNIASTQLTDSSDLARLDATTNHFLGQQNIDVDSANALAVRSFTGHSLVLNVDTVTPGVSISANLDMGGFNVNNAALTNSTIDATVGGNAASLTNLNGGALQLASVKADKLQNAAADLGAADVNVDLSNNNATFVTNITTNGAVTAGDFNGDLTGNVTGNADTATQLQTARTIGGVSFDGTANITVASATGGFTVSGGNLNIGANSLALTGDIASVGSPVANAWFTNLNATNVAITGGTIDSTVIGGGTPAAGHFTNLSATGNVDLHSASALTVPITSFDLFTNTSCVGSNGTFVYSSDATHPGFYGCVAGTWTPL